MDIDTTNQYKKYIDKYLELEYKSILEVGCGQGTITKHLISNNKVTVIDPEKSNIEIVQDKYPNINTKIGSAEKLDFEDKSFDIVIYCLSFHHVKDMKKALEEANRVLKDDGVICFIEITNEGSYLKCELLFYDETKGRDESHRNIDENDFFKIINDGLFNVKWQWNDKEDFYQTAVQPLTEDLSEETSNQINQILEENIVDDKILMDAETRIVVSKKK